VSREKRTRLNNMVAERAPSTGISQPGKATLADDENEDEQQDEQAPTQGEQTPRPRSVFDPPLQRDLDQPERIDSDDPADE
jgi:hypothetical protein